MESDLKLLFFILFKYGDDTNLLAPKKTDVENGASTQSLPLHSLLPSPSSSSSSSALRTPFLPSFLPSLPALPEGLGQSFQCEGPDVTRKICEM